MKDFNLSKQKVRTKHSDLFGNACRELDDIKQNRNSPRRLLLPGLRCRADF